MPALRRAVEQLIQQTQQRGERSKSINGASNISLDELQHVLADHRKLVDANDNIAKQVGELNMTMVRSNAEIVTELQANRRLLAGNRRLLEMGTLQWAMSNASIGAFRYIDVASHEVGLVTSEKLVRNILSAFAKGKCTFLDDGIRIQDENNAQQRPKQKPNWYGRCSEVDQVAFDALAEKAAFHDALKEQISGLTGQNPRIAQHDSGKYAIYQT